ncbi:hypothetical protein GGX14DRAFT_362304 [Mycena pura]|uniref:Uncharacterized protein n=1 Tax=Mycena pura TaxID=153505 RepID=A0AAD6VFZ7_9AGAR|nr:hypothetical protein GGX14DRAFT_362304 [Mycena pura]
MSESISELENGAQGLDSSDPASSLRAAALLTLKSKRRKPVDTAGSSGRPHPQLSDTSIQLDYGQEEVIKSSTKDVEMPPVPSLKTSNSGTEDGQMREEGEISDSEDAPSKVVSKIGLDNPVVLKAESPTHTLLDRIRDPPHPGPSLSPVSTGEVYVDPEHVRPGLSMNQDQYDTAKDIVLDLLGWGVPPDYLVDCNLSREIVYYVFSELNLRLPRNLDITGLVPYTPFHVAKYSRPLTAIPTSARSEEPASFRSLHGHPSLPAKPLVGPDDILEPSPVPKSAASQPSPHRPSSPLPATSPTDEHSSAASLHDMERQRRQELLARKAVQASRKVKPVSNASSTASSYFAPGEQSEAQDQDVAMIPVIATEAVDDFLKTIGEKSVTPEVVVKPEPTDSIDIDEIPGLGGPNRNAGSSFEGTGPENQTQSMYTDQVVISPSVTPTQSLPQNDPSPSSGDSGSTTLGNEQASYDDQLSHHRSLQRRGVKRPTAADFVDFDSSSQNGRTNGSLPPLKRKTASFASVSGQRKLVIDLSDSEGGEDFALHDSAEPDRFDGGSGYSSPAPGWFSATPVNTGWATPPSIGANTPAALVEKEQEIRKMRELIAQREKSRMQKVVGVLVTSRLFSFR